MVEMPESVRAFLSLKHIAVAGVSRSGNSPANAIYRKLCDTGHVVYAVNPKASDIKGIHCFSNLNSIDGPIDAVVAVTSPAVTLAIVRDCVALKIGYVWMHQSFRAMGSSVSDEAVRVCRENGVTVIPGGCPMMYCEPVDIAHRCARWILGATGKLPVGA